MQPEVIRAYLGLGGNLGDPASAMAAALQAIDAEDTAKVAMVSSLYRTPPWGVVDQPDFLNAVAAVDTTLGAGALLDLCLEIERSLKRIRAERWGPRLIDIDILLFGDRQINEDSLHVPHMRMNERAFVLMPLAEIAPDLMLGAQTVQQRLDSLDSSAIIRLPGGRDWWRNKADSASLA